MRSAANVVIATVWLAMIAGAAMLPAPWWNVPVVLLLVTGLARHMYAQGILTGHDMDRSSAYPPAQWVEWGASSGPGAPPGLPGTAVRNERPRWPLPPPGGTAPPGGTEV
jgi:hypothetical protein